MRSPSAACGMKCGHASHLRRVPIQSALAVAVGRNEQCAVTAPAASPQRTSRPLYSCESSYKTLLFSPLRLFVPRIRLSLWALVPTQVPTLPSPPNTSEPRRVCVWGRRAGDERRSLVKARPRREILDFLDEPSKDCQGPAPEPPRFSRHGAGVQ